MSAPAGPAVDGVLVVDKPAGITSHDVVAEVRVALGLPRNRRRRGPQLKVGHTGTLDPDATGVLVVCIGRATRLVPFLQASRKTYEARMRLGIETDTLDAAGRVTVTTDPSGVDEATLCDALQSFVGAIEQVPPMVSAVKVGGEKLLAKHLRGEEIERAARPVTVHDIVLADFEPGPEASAEFLVTCSAGTYVRTLAADVGERLGVGAHLAMLRRLGSGSFVVADAVGLDEVRALGADGRLGEALLDMAEATRDLPRVHLDEGAVRDLGHGKRIAASGKVGPVAAVGPDGGLVAVIEDVGDETARSLVVLQPTPAAPATVAGA